MSTGNIRAFQIKTERLLLRPTRASDGLRAIEIQSDWAVARMLSMARFPPDAEETGRWFADHARQWSSGEAYRFAVDFDARIIGIVDIGEIDGDEGELGYWFERSVWGRGYGYEAARAAVGFAFAEIGLARLRSGHADDNAASASVLLKLGFRHIETVKVLSRSR